MTVCSEKKRDLRPPLHIVQVGWDTALLEAGAAADSRERQTSYARLLQMRRPGSHSTIIVLGASASACGFSDGNLTAIASPGRWAGIARLSRTLRAIASVSPISAIATQSPFEEAWAALAFARGLVPVLAQVHFDLLADAALPEGSLARLALGRARRRLSILLLPHYAGVRTVTPTMATRLLELGARSTRSIPVPIPHLDAFRAVAGQAWPGDAARVLFVGRLAPEKDLPLWLEVARRVALLVPVAQFDIVGDGAEMEALKTLARDLGLADRVTFHGAVGRTELPALFSRASVLLLSSRHEGFGRVLVEAMAAGVAVVSTRTRGAVELIGESGGGLLANTGDAGDLALNVVRLLTDAALREQTIAAGARIAGQYDPLPLAEAWVDMLIEAAESPPPATRRQHA